MKKKRTLLKIFMPLLALVICASVLTGCTFSYDEEVDMNQVILEINPVEIEYEVPMMTKLLTPDGKEVTADYNYDRKADKFGEKNTHTVMTVKRTHDGEAIHIAKVDGSGNILYRGEDENGNEVEVTATDAKAYREYNKDNYYVVPATSNENDAYNGEEYEFLGIETKNNQTAAKWKRLSDGVVVYGNVSTSENSDVTLAGDAFTIVQELPFVTYNTATKKGTWQELQPVSETAVYTSEKEEFFKYTMVAYFENYATNLVQSEGMTVDEVFNYFIKNFYLSYFTEVEADVAILSGEAEWGLTEINNINKTIYDGVDAALEDFYAEIAGDFDQTWKEEEDTSASATDTTYPTPEEEGVAEGYEYDYEFWTVSSTPERVPGKTTTGDVKSMQLEGMRRFVNSLSETIENNYAISSTEKAEYLAEIATMKTKIAGSASDITELYENLWTYDVIYFLYGESQEYTLRTEAYKTSLGSDIELQTEVENKEYFKELLASQKASYDEDVQNYYDAVTNGDTVLYNKDNEYFWVKHILIPFSDEQTASLESYSTNHTDAQIKAYRQNLGENVVVYKHVNGEDDTSVSYTIDQAFADIYSRMSSTYGDAYAAERTFNELIYTYNTDPGIFPNDGNNLGYAVTRTPESEGGIAESYMIEFATEARALLGAYESDMTLYEYKLQNSNKYEVSSFDAKFMNRTEVEIGSISAPILTDYGWHIMYLCKVPTGGDTATYNSYTTAGKYETYGEAINRELYETTLDNLYNTRRELIADKYSKMDGVIVVYKDRFKANLDEYADLLYTSDDDESTDTSTDTSEST